MTRTFKLKVQSGREKVPIFVDFRKIHKKWSIFGFGSRVLITNVADIIAFENFEILVCIEKID